MSWFARIEETCAAFIERAFANMFPSDVEPAQIARKLVAVMETRTRQTESVLVAPARYMVTVSPGDFDRLSAHRAYLEKEWAALLADVAARVGIRFGGGVPGPSVILRAGDSVTQGAIEVDAAEDRPATVFVLRPVSGPAAGKNYRVKGKARLGRSRECEIHLADPSVSRNHAVLEVLDGSLTVNDNGSTNGTFVNGSRVKSSALNAGDVVAFGRTEMRVERES